MSEPGAICAICQERVEPAFDILDHLRVLHPGWEDGGEGQVIDPVVVRAEDFPHGLRCGECSRLLEPGDIYTHTPEPEMAGLRAWLIVCFDCGYKAMAQGQPDA